MIVSDAKAAANRANAQASTGPRTAAGKSRVRRNACTHGLYGATVPDSGEDADAFARLHLDYKDRLLPRGPAEDALVARLASIMWRLARVPGAEHAVYAAHEQDVVPDDDSGAEVAVDLPDLWGRAHGAGAIESALARINRHEAHLQRMAKRTLETLAALQALRAGEAPSDLSHEESLEQESQDLMYEIGANLDRHEESEREGVMCGYLQALREHTGIDLAIVEPDGSFAVITS